MRIVAIHKGEIDAVWSESSPHSTFSGPRIYRQFTEKFTDFFGQYSVNNFIGLRHLASGGGTTSPPPVGWGARGRGLGGGR